MVLYRSIVQIGRYPLNVKEQVDNDSGSNEIYAWQPTLCGWMWFNFFFSFSFSWHKLKIQEFKLPCISVSKHHNISVDGESYTK